MCYLRIYYKTIDLKTTRLNSVNFFESSKDLFVADANNNLKSISRFNLQRYLKDLNKEKLSEHPFL